MYVISYADQIWRHSLSLYSSINHCVQSDTVIDYFKKRLICLDIKLKCLYLQTGCLCSWVYLRLLLNSVVIWLSSLLFPLRSNTSDSTVRSTESVGVRQPAKSKIRRHNNRLSTVFNHSPNLRDSGRRGQALAGELQAADDPAELSSQMSVPGILKIFGSDICQGTNYKSVLATTQSSAKELVKEALERWGVSLNWCVCYILDWRWG